MKLSLAPFIHSIKFPVLFLLSVAVVLTQSDIELSPWRQLLVQTPFLLFVAAIVLAWRFNQTKIVYISLFLILSWAIHSGIEHFPYLGFHPSLFYVSQLLVLVAFAFDRNKHVWGRHGLLRSLLLFAVVYVNYAFNQSPTVTEVFNWQLIDSPLLQHSGNNIQIELLATIVALVLVALRQQLTSNQVYANLWIIIGGFAVIQFVDLSYDQQLVSLCLFAVLLIHGVLTDSYQMAFSDELTGLAARRALLQSSLSLGKRYTIAMMDVDHFKKFNDTYGHDVGDQVLRLVASKLRGVKGGGKAYRYGGEEFTIVFPKKDVAYAIPFLEQVREEIANYDMAIRSEERPDDTQQGKSFRKKVKTKTEFVNVTISIGVAERDAELKDFDQVLKRADEALYRAKQSGRNCLAE